MVDFIDLGCGIGGSIDWSKKKFKGKTHLGIDNRQENCEIAKSKGFNVIFGDITSDDITLPEARYTTMLHFLEHLKNEDDVRNVLKKVLSVTKDFVFIKVPYFDSYDYLKNLGFKLTWTDWKGHPTAVTKTLLETILDEYNLEYEIGYLYPVNNSTSKEIIPYTAPVDTIIYDETMGVKEYKEFEGVYRETYCFIRLSCDYWEDLIKTNIL